MEKYSEPEEEPNNECYIFNTKLQKRFNDGKCEHCLKWLTLDCEKIDEFVDDIDSYDDVE